MNRNLAIFGAVAVVVVAMMAFFSRTQPGASGVPEDEREETEDLVGGYGALGGGGGSGHGARHDGGRVPHDGVLDAGVHAHDSGEGAPVPLASEPSREHAPAPVVPASVTFTEERTVEDEYDAANMVWTMIQMRRAEARTQLAEARRTGDQRASTRIAHQLELLEISDRRAERLVHDLGARLGSTPATEDTAHAEGSEGASPE